MAADPGAGTANATYAKQMTIAGKEFFLNVDTGVATWELPEGVTEEAIRYVMYLTQGDDKKPFYVDKLTGESVWQLPKPTRAATAIASTATGNAPPAAAGAGTPPKGESPGNATPSPRRKGYLGLAKRLNARNLAKPAEQAHAASPQQRTAATNAAAPPPPPPPPPRDELPPARAPAPALPAPPPPPPPPRQQPAGTPLAVGGSQRVASTETNTTNHQAQPHDVDKSPFGSGSVFRPGLPEAFRQMRNHGRSAEPRLLVDPTTGEPTAKFHPGFMHPSSTFSDALLEYLGPNTPRIVIGNSSGWANVLRTGAKLDREAQTGDELLGDVPHPKVVREMQAALSEERAHVQAVKQQLQAAEATTANQVVEFMCVMSEERQQLKSEQEHLERLHALRMQQLLELASLVQHKHQEATALMRELEKREKRLRREELKNQQAFAEREQNLALHERRLEQAQARLQKEHERRERQLEQEYLRTERRYDNLQSELMRTYSSKRLPTSSAAGSRLRAPSYHWSSRPSSARPSPRNGNSSPRVDCQFGSAQYQIEHLEVLGSPSASNRSNRNRTESAASSIGSGRPVHTKSPRSIRSDRSRGWRPEVKTVADADSHAQLQQENDHESHVEPHLKRGIDEESEDGYSQARSLADSQSQSQLQGQPDEQAEWQRNGHDHQEWEADGWPWVEADEDEDHESTDEDEDDFEEEEREREKEQKKEQEKEDDGEGEEQAQLAETFHVDQDVNRPSLVTIEICEDTNSDDSDSEPSADDTSVPSTQPEGSVNSILDISELVESSREQLTRRPSVSRVHIQLRRPRLIRPRRQPTPTPTAIIDLQSLVQQTRVS